MFTRLQQIQNLHEKRALTLNIEHLYSCKQQTQTSLHVITVWPDSFIFINKMDFAY